MSTVLDIWPDLPIAVITDFDFRGPTSDDKLIMAIRHYDRVYEISLRSFFRKRHLESFVSVMQVPFPALTDLAFTFKFHHELDRTLPVLPDSFLGRSAPRLRHLELEGLSFPGLPNLLLSTSGLASLKLRCIPHSWYISPEAMVALLNALTRLELLTLQFEFH